MVVATVLAREESGGHTAVSTASRAGEMGGEPVLHVC